MHNWRFLIPVLAVIGASATFSERTFTDVRQQCFEQWDQDSPLSRSGFIHSERPPTTATSSDAILRTHERVAYQHCTTNRIDHLKRDVANNRERFTVSVRRLDSPATLGDRQIFRNRINERSIKINSEDPKNRGLIRIVKKRHQFNSRRVTDERSSGKNRDTQNNIQFNHISRNTRTLEAIISRANQDAEDVHRRTRFSSELRSHFNSQPIQEHRISEEPNKKSITRFAREIRIIRKRVDNRAHETRLLVADRDLLSRKIHIVQRPQSQTNEENRQLTFLSTRTGESGRSVRMPIRNVEDTSQFSNRQLDSRLNREDRERSSYRNSVRASQEHVNIDFNKHRIHTKDSGLDRRDFNIREEINRHRDQHFHNTRFGKEQATPSSQQGVNIRVLYSDSQRNLVSRNLNDLFKSKFGVERVRSEERDFQERHVEHFVNSREITLTSEERESVGRRGTEDKSTRSSRSIDLDLRRVEIRRNKKSGRFTENRRSSLSENNRESESQQAIGSRSSSVSNRESESRRFKNSRRESISENNRESENRRARDSLRLSQFENNRDSENRRLTDSRRSSSSEVDRESEYRRTRDSRRSSISGNNRESENRRVSDSRKDSASENIQESENRRARDSRESSQSENNSDSENRRLTDSRRSPSSDGNIKSESQRLTDNRSSSLSEKNRELESQRLRDSRRLSLSENKRDLENRRARGSRKESLSETNTESENRRLTDHRRSSSSVINRESEHQRIRGNRRLSLSENNRESEIRRERDSRRESLTENNRDLENRRVRDNHRELENKRLTDNRRSSSSNNNRESESGRIRDNRRLSLSENNRESESRRVRDSRREALSENNRDSENRRARDSRISSQIGNKRESENRRLTDNRRSSLSDNNRESESRRGRDSLRLSLSENNRESESRRLTDNRRSALAQNNKERKGSTTIRKADLITRTEPAQRFEPSVMTDQRTRITRENDSPTKRISKINEPDSLITFTHSNKLNNRLSLKNNFGNRREMPKAFATPTVSTKIVQEITENYLPKVEWKIATFYFLQSIYVCAILFQMISENGLKANMSKMDHWTTSLRQGIKMN